MTDKRDFSLKACNTFGIEARCSRFMEYASSDEALHVSEVLRAGSKPHMVIGAGSNLLLTGDYDGIVVRSAIRGMSIVTAREQNDDDVVTLRCGSGEKWDDVVSWSIAMGFPHLVNLSLIPGDVGAAAVQNIGAYGAEAAQFISEVKAVEVQTGRTYIFDNADCQYGYRDSRFKHEWKNRFLITHVTFRLKGHTPLNTSYGNIDAELRRLGITQPTARQLRQVIIDIRRQKLPDPQTLGNAGSFFMNPVVERSVYESLASRYPQMPHYFVDDTHEKIPAGWLIEQCGWKGRSLGRAGVYERQALVLVNLGGATGADIVALCRAIQADVQQRFGINIQPEVNIV